MDKSDYFETELFIEEVHNLPCIWDYTADACSNRVEKAKAWELLCSKFYDNFDEMGKEEKQECALKLQRKWRSLRDSYSRELRTLNNLQKSGKSKRRKYIYFNNLYFLRPLAERRGTDGFNKDSLENEDARSSDDLNYHEIVDEQVKQEDKYKKRRNAETNSIDKETELIEKLSSRLSDRISAEEPKVTHTDSDLHFLMSLYDRFKAIDDRLKMDAQIEILGVIKKYSSPQPHPINYS